MNDFFKKAIDKSLDIDCLDKTVIVIPNRRSRGFLKQAIQNRLKKTSISPEIYSIDDFIERIADIKESENTTILFHLYESYMEISKNKDFENYNSFRKWANIFLKDLNDIQMSSNNFSEVFNYLFEIKKINAINQEDELKLEFWKKTGLCNLNARLYNNIIIQYIQAKKCGCFCSLYPSTLIDNMYAEAFHIFL